MDSWTARKRPWEESGPINVQLKRRESTDNTPPLPQYADHYPRDSQSLSQRRLPPPCTTSYGLPTALHTSNSLQLSSPVDKLKPRAQSLSDVFQSPKRLRRDTDFGKTASYFCSTLSLLAPGLLFDKCCLRLSVRWEGALHPLIKCRIRN